MENKKKERRKDTRTQLYFLSLRFPLVKSRHGLWAGVISPSSFQQRINFRGSVTCDQLDSRDERRNLEAMPPSHILSGFNIMSHLHNKFSFFVLHVPWLRVLHIIQF